MGAVSPVNGHQYFGDKPVPAKSDLDMETFMRLLTVQLVNQNPLEPMNDRDFFAQMAQLGQVEGLDKVQDSLNMSQANDLIGKTVTAVRPGTLAGHEGENMVTGRVEGMTIRNGKRIVAIREEDGGVAEVELNGIRNVIVDDSVQAAVEMTQAVGLIGKTVTAANPFENPANPDDDLITGQAVRVTVAEGKQIIGVKVDDKIVDVEIKDIYQVQG